MVKADLPVQPLKTINTQTSVLRFSIGLGAFERECLEIILRQNSLNYKTKSSLPLGLVRSDECKDGED